MGKSSTTKSFNGFQDEEMNFGFEKKNEDNNEDNISLDLKYRHGLTGKELSRRAKELKKRQNREREQRRDNKTQNYNYAREMQQLSHSVPVEILKNAQNVENSDFNSATMTMMTPTTDGDMNSAYQQSMSVGASASSFGNNHSSPAGQQATKYYYSMSPASANKNMMSRSLENNFGELGSPNADDGFGLRQMLLSPTKFKANRRELRRLFGKLEFESMDKSSLERVFCIVEIGKKSSKTVQLSEFLETENAPYHAIRRVERNVMNSDTGIASVEVLWDVKDRNYASPPPPAAPSSSSACNNNNNNNNNKSDAFEITIVDGKRGGGERDNSTSEEAASYLLFENENIGVENVDNSHVLYEDPNDDDIAHEVKRKRDEEIKANRRRKQEQIAQREIREALKKASVSNENAELLERKAKELKDSCDTARASARIALHETQRLKIETEAAQRRAEAHVIDTARSQRARKMLESAAEKIRDVEEEEEEEEEGGDENNNIISRVSESEQHSLDQSASDKLREVESERERLSRLLRHAWEQEVEKVEVEEEEEGGFYSDDEDEKLRRAINRAHHLLESRHDRISFSASFVHDKIDKLKGKTF